MPNPSIKDETMYRELRKSGASQEKAARISNAMAAEGRSKVGRRGGEAEPYDQWTRDELRSRARELGIEGRSTMNKSQLIKALRSH